MKRKVTKWLTVALVTVGVLSQLGVLPPVVLDALSAAGAALEVA